MKINIYLVLILTLAFFLRFWHLSLNPPSLNWDEVSNGYNAYSVLKTARDEYGSFLPLTFRSFDDYRPALSVYTLVPSIALFGLNEFAVRFPSAFFGSLTIFLTYFLVVRLTQNRLVSLLAAFLLAISPWHLQFSRYDHEANFMIFFAIAGLTIFLYSANKYWLLILSAISFGFALNTYQGAKLWIPLFLIAIGFWFAKQIFKLGLKLLPILGLLFLFTLPSIVNFQQTSIRAKSVGIFGQKDHLFNTFVSGYLAHFSPNFLFIAGDTIGRHSIGGMGQLYVFELPLIIIGLTTLLRQKTSVSKFLLTWLLIAPIPAALATPTPHAARSITFLPLLSIIAAYGFNQIISAKIKRNVKYLLIMTLVSIALYNISTYLHLYYKHYPKLKAYDWQDGYKEMVQFVNQVKADYEVVAVTNYYGRPYIFVLFYSQYDPNIYQKQSQNKSKFDKFEFFGESWEKKTSGKALLVRPAWQIPNPPPTYLKFIYATSGDLVFRISEE